MVENLVLLRRASIVCLRLLCFIVVTWADSESFVRRGPTLTLFLVDEGRKHPNTTISGPSLVRHLNGVSLACQ